jgi:hypothetical protein
MLAARALPARIVRPITDQRLVQACAAEEFFEALLKDLYLDLRRGATLLASKFIIVERLRPPPRVACLAGECAKIVPLARRRYRNPEPITDERLERAFIAECLRDAIVGDLYEDADAGAVVLTRRCTLLWRPRPIQAIRLRLGCVTS